MVQNSRSFWKNKIEAEWRRRSIVWLSGVRRAGKTVLSQSLPDIEYFDCELPRVRREMEDPEAFLRRVTGKRVVLDEIHRLANPSELLKIAADHFPGTKVLATGSSTLQASAKFQDTLTGRKSEIWLTPMMSADLKDFGNDDLKHRFLFGGLPPFWLSDEVPERDFQEWIDSYWSKDIQELFRLERHASFKRFLELIFADSGGVFEATKYAAPCEISRPTVANYLNALELTWVAHVVRPFSTRRRSEIVSAPKVYAFDTGFVCYFKGWYQLRPSDIGYLWEHYVLNEMHSRLAGTRPLYWRSKSGREIDFVWARHGRPPAAIECKWTAAHFDPANMRTFRKLYPQGLNLVVARDVDRPYVKNFGDLVVDFVDPDGLIGALAGV